MASYFLQAKGCQRVSENFMPMLSPTIKHLANVITQYTWSPIIYKDNYRAQRNFVLSYFCALDVDNKDEQYSLSQALEDFADCEVIIGTTRSHQKEKGIEGAKDRFRIIIPWENPITNLADYVHTMKGITQARPYFDDSCVDGARLFYPCTKIVLLSAEGFRQKSASAPKNSRQTLPPSNRSPSVSKPLPYHIVRFLKKGIPFAQGRQRSCYLTALHLLEAGSDPSQILEVIKKSPFNRKDFSDYEIKQAVNNAIRKVGLTC